MQVKKEEKKLEKEENTRKCIICNAIASFCVKGMPQVCYCKECALKQFKQLNYLEKL